MEVHYKMCLKLPVNYGGSVLNGHIGATAEKLNTFSNRTIFVHTLSLFPVLFNALSGLSTYNEVCGFRIQK